MSVLFVEISCEEIPARFQSDAISALQSRLMDGLKESGFSPEAGRVAISPRHMAVEVAGLEARLADQTIERRGPRCDAPDKAVEGFCQSAGIVRNDLEIRVTEKGCFFFARIMQTGVTLSDILVPLINNVVSQFPWPKSQRWSCSTVTWVRPLTSVSLLVDGVPVTGNIDLGGGILMALTNKVNGHPFYPHEAIMLTNFDTYVAEMRAANVIVDSDERRDMIVSQSKTLASAEGSVVVLDDSLLHEITGLVEWPHAILGKIQPEFMELPAEVLVTSMRVHQKFFATRFRDAHEKSGQLSPYFITIANRDCNAEQASLIAAGNERVLRARLSDAAFFWQQDRAMPLDSLVPKLSSVAFFDGLGSIADKTNRVAVLAGHLAFYIPECREDDAVRAAQLSKADLVTGMVGEFPELQGVMGGYYAVSSHETEAVSQAISDHYRPQGPFDSLPRTAEGFAVSIADKLDTLAGFFGVNQKPTGSRDPYALRRAALGILRIMDEADISLPLHKLMKHAADLYHFADVDSDLPTFFRDRLRVVLRDKGLPHDVVSAVLNCHQGVDNLHLVMHHARQLDRFLKTEGGNAVLFGWRRVTSLLIAEEKKGALPKGKPSEKLFETEEEVQLMAALTSLPVSKAETRDAMIDMMVCMTSLAVPVQQFFKHVVVNSEINEVRENRLFLLSLVQTRMALIGDLSQIEGGHGER